MGKCRSANDVRTDHILHEKWRQNIVAVLIDGHDEFVKLSRKGRSAVVGVEDLEELLDEASMRKYRYRSFGVFSKQFIEATEQVKKLLSQESSFDEYFDKLLKSSTRINLVYRRTDDSDLKLR